MSLKILILGANGFIGHHLTKRILDTTNWTIYGIDTAKNRLENHFDNKRFHFIQGDITLEKEWVEDQIKNCDLVIPLVAIATPSSYITNPLQVFELTFEANLTIIRQCAKHSTRLLFPSTSEVYGMCQEAEFNEESSQLVLGPIHKERWIYSCSKQLLDRIIFAYGKHHKLPFTLFRPFNWIGSNQDNIFDLKDKASRVLGQFIGSIISGQDLKLVNGGQQRRCFTYIDDGIDALIKMIENKDGCANGKIFNIGTPNNNHSIYELANLLLLLAKDYPVLRENAEKCKIISIDCATYYGKGYQDVLARVPSIDNAKKYLDWQPHTGIQVGLQKTLEWVVKQINQRSTS
jgi:nucleoside-diphosphate-sugar epimerase